MAEKDLAWEFLGKGFLGIILYCLLMVLFAMVWFPLTIILTVIAIALVLKDSE